MILICSFTKGDSHHNPVLITVATHTRYDDTNWEADLPFGRMGIVALEPVNGIYPVLPVGAFSYRRTRQTSLGASYILASFPGGLGMRLHTYVHEVRNSIGIMHTHTEASRYQYNIG